MPQSVAGAPAERPAPVSSQASARGGLAGRAAEKWELGWAVACALGHLAVGSSRACGVAPAAPPPVAEGTAGPVAETRQRGLRRAVCPGAAGAACAGWQRSAPGVPWTDHTAAGFASVPPAGRPAGQGASLLEQLALAAEEGLPHSPLGAGKLRLGDLLQVEVS